MDILAEARRRAFSLWLRTGRLPGWLRPASTEVKFNPWHDADDGRFTFAGTGRYFGRGGGTAGPGVARHSDERRRRGPPRGGGGGGGWGKPKPYGGYAGGQSAGGGATGSWDAPAPSSQPTRGERTGPASSGGAARAPRPAAGTAGTRSSPAAARPQPSRPERGQRDPNAPAAARAGPTNASRPAETNWRRIESNGYEYLIDESGRTRRVSGDLTLRDTQPRSRIQQARAGGEDRRGSDDGGHYIARRFGGPTEAFNHFAQDANFNRGGYRALEDQWARAIRAEKRVKVRIEPIYEGPSQRPSIIKVQFWIDGKWEIQSFRNERKGTKSAR